MAENFHDYSNKIPINRQKKDKLIADIIVLGKTIALNELSEGVDNVYKKSEPEPPLDLTNSDTLIKFVNQLKYDQDEKYNRLFESYNALKTDHDVSYNALKAENDDFKSRLAICELKLGGYSESDNADLSEERLTSDSDTDSVRLSVTKRSKKKHRKAMVIKSDIPKVHPEPVQAASNPIPVEAATNNTYAFIGNVSTACTSESILQHITGKIKVPLKITDTKELNIKSNNKAFKITVPRGLLHKVISDWPKDIKAEPYALPRTKASTPRSSKGAHSQQKKFRRSSHNSNKPQHNRHWGRNYDHYGAYQELYQPYYRY